MTVFMGTLATNDDRSRQGIIDGNLGIYDSSGILYGEFSRGCYVA